MSKIMPHRLLGIVFLGVTCLTGCRTDDEAHSGQMASVEISGHTEREIAQAAKAVFLADGFVQTENLVFEKQGSRWETMNYGGWSTDLVWIRIRARLIPEEDGGFKLGCDAYVVEDHGQPGIEEEHKFLVAKRDECKKILDQIKASLEGSPAPAGANTRSAP